MLSVRNLSGVGLLALIGLIGYAEDNDKSMMQASGTTAPAGAPAVTPDATPVPAGNDAEARKKYEMERQKKMYSQGGGYPGMK